MAKKKKQKKAGIRTPKKSLVDLKKIKSFGITKETINYEIEEIDGEEISGGKDTSPTTAVCQQWPTTGGA